MVSQDKASAASRDRLLKAAAAEFAARGFDGAKVDRIAARARVNKAMVYYHFDNKAALYREILRDVFGAAAAAVEAVPAAGGTPEQQLRAFIAAVSSSAVARPHFPPIWLRELAEGGRHLDASVLAQMGRVIGTLVRILRAGVESGVFREVHPIIAQMGIVAPLLLFSASAPARERLKAISPLPMTGLTHSAVLAYVQDATLAALASRRSGS
jgi:TetR/AcrR family transcriptional regulator